MTRPTNRLRTLVLLVLAAASLPAGPASRAQPTAEQAGSSFTFTGRGWGHGLGMSQWGAKGLADRGWSAIRVLTHFYRSTQVGTRAGPAYGGSPNTIRIGLFQKSAGQRISGDGAVEFLVDGAVVATTAPGETWSVRPTSDGRFAIHGTDGAPFGTFGGESAPMQIRFEERGTILSLPEVGHRYRYGTLELNVYAPEGPWQLRGVLTLDFERYLYGLGEMPSSWPVEALKAQAVAARTYALEKASRLGQNRPGCNCALYATTVDQAYIGYDKESGSGGSRWRAAVDDTRGEVVLIDDGGLKPIEALYSSSSGGATEDNEKQWGGTARPYLRGVCDPGDYAAGDNPNANWSVTLDEPTVRSRLSSGGYDVGVVRTIEFPEPRGVSGRAVQVVDQSRGGVRVTGSTGTARLSGDRFRSLMGLKSNLFSPPLFGGIRERWDSLDCAPGLPATAEYDWTYLGGRRWGRAQDFTGSRLFWNERTGKVWLNYGGILAKYDELRRAGVDIGGPDTDEVAVRGGRAVFYELGHVYWSSSTGPHLVFGGILDRYLEIGGSESSGLGLPTRDEEDVPGGRRSRFQNGQLTWNASNGAVLMMYGGILDRWEALEMAPGHPADEEHDWRDLAGAWRGRAEDFASGRLFWDATVGKVFWTYGGILSHYDVLRRGGFDLGMPSTDEIDVRGGRASHFERGRIYWSGSTDAHVVYGGILEKYLEVGGPDSRLGLPKTDEYAWQNGRRSDFQAGFITWTPETGAVVQYA